MGYKKSVQERQEKILYATACQRLLENAAHLSQFYNGGGVVIVAS
jgi:hypothetical protein